MFAEYSISVDKRRGSHEAEYLISVDKRRAPHEALAAEEPNPKRIDTSAETLDPSLITLLVNDKFIKGLAHVLSVDQNLVQRAEKLIESLQGAEAENGTLNLDDWQHFTSLQIWQNEQLRSRLSRYPLPFTMIGSKRAWTDQQIKEQIARVNGDSSLKPLFREKEHIRVVLIILATLLSCKDVFGDLSEPARTEEPLGSGLDDGNAACPDDVTEIYSDFQEYDVDMRCCYDNFVDDKFHMLDKVHMIGSLNRDSYMETEALAQEVIKDSKVYQILEQLLDTVSVVSQGTKPLQHFDKVKKVWANRRFIDILSKVDFIPNKRCADIAKWRLSKFIMSHVKEDPLFDLILDYQDTAFKMRVALSILVGFWSNEDMILPLVCSMGGDALGVKIRYSTEVEDEESHVGLGEEIPELFAGVGVSGLPQILDIYGDESIGELAEQLKQVPRAVELAGYYLESLKGGDCHCSYSRHRAKAMGFWLDLSVHLQLIEAIKKLVISVVKVTIQHSPRTILILILQDPHLIKVLTKYSKGAQFLRCRQQMIYLGKDPKLRSNIDSPDPGSRMWLALSILFGYWVDRDVTRLFRTSYVIRKITGKVDLNGIAAFDYFARSATDVEGLENWLANIYGGSSEKFNCLASKFGKFQIAMAEAAKERGYSDGDLVSIILCMDMEDDSILSFRMFWLKPQFGWTSCMCVEYPERDAHSYHRIWWGNRLWYPLHRNCRF